MVKGGRWPKYCTLRNPRLVNNKNMCMCTWSHFSRVWLYVTLWTVALQAPLSMEFSRQEYWTGLPCPTWGNLPDPGIKPTSHMSPALASRFFSTSATWEGQQEYRDDCFLRGWILGLWVTESLISKVLFLKISLGTQHDWQYSQTTGVA